MKSVQSSVLSLGDLFKVQGMHAANQAYMYMYITLYFMNRTTNFVSIFTQIMNSPK